MKATTALVYTGCHPQPRLKLFATVNPDCNLQNSTEHSDTFVISRTACATTAQLTSTSSGHVHPQQLTALKPTPTVQLRMFSTAYGTQSYSLSSYITEHLWNSSQFQFATVNPDCNLQNSTEHSDTFVISRTACATTAQLTSTSSGHVHPQQLTALKPTPTVQLRMFSTAYGTQSYSLSSYITEHLWNSSQFQLEQRRVGVALSRDLVACVPAGCSAEADVKAGQHSCSARRKRRRLDVATGCEGERQYRTLISLLGLLATMRRVVNYHSSWARQRQVELFDASGIRVLYHGEWLITTP
ncbi:pentatricopeptide repeat-containing protein [Dorcoceras hygrometricum]|uniref:Pentatricopeptide repeat-containing protein n=1 Tax=Dorcoceras hygrometricum TaxID=472368 RepID=A0A2Z7ANV3_9LAMI|nr:pentatricopeptide repeat-containing protein [Dorcoceras hygrometricum]